MKIKSEGLKAEKEIREIGEFHMLFYGIEGFEEGYCGLCKGKCKAVPLEDKYDDKIRIISIKPAEKRI